jgi:hypothetical protein
VFDRPSAVVDTSCNSDFFGCLYVAINAFANDNSGVLLVLYRSCDGSKTWTALPVAKITDAAYYLAISNTWVVAAISSHGVIHVTAQTDNSIMYWRSKDGGVTYTPLYLIGTWSGGANALRDGGGYVAYPGIGIRETAAASPMTVASTNNDDVYSVWNQCNVRMTGANVHCRTMLSQSHNNGETWTTQAIVDVPDYSTTFSTVATSTDGKRVFIMFYMFTPEFPTGTLPEVYNNVSMTLSYIYSLDSGKSFTPPSTLSNVFDPTWVIQRRFVGQPWTLLGDYNTAVFDGEGNVHATWADASGGAPCQPWFDFEQGTIGLPFDFFAQCPNPRSGRTDIFYRKVSFVPDPMLGIDLSTAL